MALLSTKLTWELAQTKWASILNPLLSEPLLAGNQLDSIFLKAGTPKTINHLLQRLPQGWFVVDINANAVVWKTQNWTTTTITLDSSADTTISIYVY